jgi:hypothetical protein
VSQYIVGFQRSPNEWVFAGVYDVADVVTSTPEEAAAAEAAAEEEAVRRAALDYDESDAFAVMNMANVRTVRIAYRRRVVGIVKDPPAV